MEDAVFDPLSLDSQLCFPLYACAREVIRRYQPLLERLGLTYTQYITMMVLWEKKCQRVKDLGEKLYLDSGTLTPLLKKLEARGLIARRRDPSDERSLLVTLTPAGEALRAEALPIPQQIGACISFPPEDAAALYTLLYRLLNSLNGNAPGEAGTEFQAPDRSPL